jgi:hypothetical protein
MILYKYAYMISTYIHDSVKKNGAIDLDADLDEKKLLKSGPNLK